MGHTSRYHESSEFVGTERRTTLKTSAPHRSVLAIACIWIVFASSAVHAQFGDGSGEEAPAQDVQQAAKVAKWRVGMTVQAVGGPCTGLYGTIPVPAEWPGQTVRIIDEDISSSVRKVRYRTVRGGGAKQMLITIPRLASGESARAIVTFEVERTPVPPPTDTDSLKIPAKPPRELKAYLSPSPKIESRHAEIRGLATELVDEQLNDWQQIERFYDEVRARVEYQNGPLKGALKALRDGTGDCEELTSLFVAVCRAHGVPARTVWVPDHCYPEFYLVDQEENGHWISCEAAGDRAFGFVHDLRPILQKGDNFKVPEKKQPQRYVAEHLTGKAGGGKPRVRFIRDEILDRR